MRESVWTEPSTGLLVPVVLSALGYAGMTLGVHGLLAHALRPRDYTSAPPPRIRRKVSLP